MTTTHENLIKAAAVLAVIGGVAFTTSVAGPLTPPPGPVQPTGTTLDQLNAGFNGLGTLLTPVRTGCDCPPRGYRMWQSFTNPVNGTVLVAAGSGVIRSVKLVLASPSTTRYELRDANGTVMWVSTDLTISSSDPVEVNLRFDGRLTIGALGGGGSNVQGLHVSYALTTDY